MTNTIIKKFKIQDLKRQQSKLVDLQLHSGSVTANKTKAECTLQPVAKMLRRLEQKVCLMVTKKFVAKVAPITQSNVVHQCLMHDIAWLETLQWGGGWGDTTFRNVTVSHWALKYFLSQHIIIKFPHNEHPD